MAFEHNDIATKSGLRAGLGETEMGFEHNDIVTVDVMNAAIAAGGGGGGDYKTANVTVTCSDASYGIFSIEAVQDDHHNYTSFFDVGDAFYYNAIADYGTPLAAKILYVGDSVIVRPYNNVANVTGDAVYDSETGYITITGDCAISGYTDD